MIPLSASATENGTLSVYLSSEAKELEMEVINKSIRQWSASDQLLAVELLPRNIIIRPRRHDNTICHYISKTTSLAVATRKAGVIKHSQHVPLHENAEDTWMKHQTRNFEISNFSLKI